MSDKRGIAAPASSHWSNGEGYSLIETLRARSGEDLRSALYDLVERIMKEVSDTHELNAFISCDGDWLKNQADNLLRRMEKSRELPLAGLPFVVKDNIETRHFATTGGTPAFSDNFARHNATAVQKLLDAGALLVGKTNLHELAFGITSNNGFSGAVHNPWNPELIAGGSSGGTAAAIAAGVVPVGLGTDTGGSARIPAALCGIVGYRPSTGRYSADGVIRISSTRDTIGCMARSVQDVALLDGVIADTEHLLDDVDVKGLRIGIAENPFFVNLEVYVAEQMKALLKRLQEEGAELVRFDANELFELNEKVGFPVVLYETVIELNSYLLHFNRRRPGKSELTLPQLVKEIASPDVRGLLEPLLGDGAIPVAVYQDAVNRWRPKLQRAYANLFERHKIECLLYPTTPLTARPLGQDDEVELNAESVPTFATYIRNCDPSSNAGVPSVTLPVVDRIDRAHLPVGASLDGPIGTDRRLLAIAQAIEALFI